jgi:hypothetical protein
MRFLPRSRYASFAVVSSGFHNNEKVSCTRAGIFRRSNVSSQTRQTVKPDSGA